MANGGVYVVRIAVFLDTYSRFKRKALSASHSSTSQDPECWATHKPHLDRFVGKGSQDYGRSNSLIGPETHATSAGAHRAPIR